IGVLESRQGDNAPPAPFEVENGDAIDQYHARTGSALQGAPAVVFAAWPRERGTVRVRGVGRGEHANLRLVWWLAVRAQAVDRARQGELGCAEPFDEVAAAHPT